MGCRQHPQGRILCPVRLSDAFDAYRASAASRGVRSLPQLDAARKRWEAHFGPEAQVEDLTTASLEAFWASERGVLAPATARRVLGVGLAAIRSQGHTVSTPRHLSSGQRLSTHCVLSIEQARELWRAAQAREHWRRYVWLALGTGARPEALLQLQGHQFDGRLLRLAPPGWIPTKKRRPTLPVPALLAAEMASWKVGHMVTYRGRPIARAVEMFRRLSKALGWKVTAYDLRHTVATELRRRGASEYDASVWMGHAAPGSRTTELYVHERPDYLARCSQLLDTYLREVAKVVVVGATGIEPVTPTMSRPAGQFVVPYWFVPPR